MANDVTWPELPTETEIYILPSGEIVVADLPVELAARIAQILTPAAQRATPQDAAEDWQSPYVAEQ